MLHLETLLFFCIACLVKKPAFITNFFEIKKLTSGNVASEPGVQCFELNFFLIPEITFLLWCFRGKNKYLSRRNLASFVVIWYLNWITCGKISSTPNTSSPTFKNVLLCCFESVVLVSLSFRIRELIWQLSGGVDFVDLKCNAVSERDWRNCVKQPCDLRRIATNM